MQKLPLDLEMLAVESFQTAAPVLAPVMDADTLREPCRTASCPLTW